MSRDLKARLAALEGVPQPDGVQVIYLEFLRPEGEPSADEGCRSAFIVGRPGRPGCEVVREDGETAAAFMTRVEAERFRAHGPKPQTED